MIVVTGATGFIGSVLISYLHELVTAKIIAVDDFGRMDKNKNIRNKKISTFIHRKVFLEWFQSNNEKVEFVFHLGARTDTTDLNERRFNELNYHYSQEIWKICTQENIPLIYASSAATYGGGEFGFNDSNGVIGKLQPLNHYGWSKQKFDLWVLEQKHNPDNWYGFKFFNVYGPNEYHKGRMASVIFQAYNQILKTGKLKLFRSHRVDFNDGYQSRDFIYVKDVIRTILWFMKNKPENGIYNLGTGQARPFIDLATAVFDHMGQDPSIEFVDTPADIREKYQYFTQADMNKLRSLNFDLTFESLESGIQDYVTNYLIPSGYI